MSYCHVRDIYFIKKPSKKVPENGFFYKFFCTRVDIKNKNLRKD